MALFGNFWKRSQSSRVENKRARRLFMESLENRNLLAAMLSVTKTDNFTDQMMSVPAGEQILIYNITVTNIASDPGDNSNDATDIRVTDDPLPAHTRDAGVTIPDNPNNVASILVVPSNSDYRMVSQITTLRPGEHVTFAIQVAVDSDAYIATATGDSNASPPLSPHFLRNSVHVTDQSADQADITVVHDTEIASVSDLHVTITDSPDPVDHGQNLEYTITVTNDERSDAANSVLTYTALPALNPHITFVSLDTSGATGWTVTTTPTVGGSPNFEATNPQFVGSGSAVFKLTVKVDDNAPSTTITAHAEVNVPAGDNTPTNNSDDETTTIVGVPSADLEVTKTGPSGPVLAGSNVTYTITAKNAGDLVAAGVVLSDIVPAGTTFVSLDIPTAAAQHGWTADAGNPIAGGTGTVKINNASLPAASPTDTFTLVVRVNPGATNDTKIVNTASASTTSTELETTDNSQTVQNTVENDADITITKDDGVTSVNAGDTVTYTITVKNTGPGDVVATNEVQTATVTGASGTFSLTFDGATTQTPLDVASATLAADMQNALNNLSSIANVGGSVAVTQNGNVYTITFGGTLANKNVSQITSAASAGVTVNMATTVGGSGLVNIADTFPADLINVSFMSAASGGATGNTTTGMGDISDNVAMPANSMIIYTVTGKVNPSTSSTQMSNVATATAPSGVLDANQTNNTATDTDDINKSADIGISIADDHDPANPDQDLVYTYTVTNNGPSNSGVVNFQTTVPVNTTFVSFDLMGATDWVADAGNPASGAGAGATVAAMVADMAPGATALIKMTVHTLASINTNTTITNIASVSNGLDGNSANNNDTETTLVVPPEPDIVVTKSGPASGIAGQTLTYTITIGNSGFVSANGVALTDIVPTNTTFQSFTQTSTPGVPAFTKVQQPNINGTGTIKYTTPTLDVGKTATFTLVVKVNPSDIDPITNTATGSITGQTDFNPNNDSKSVTTPINTQADLTISKSASPNPVIVGSNITYTIVVNNNNGPSNAATVLLTDNLPANTTFVSMSQPAGWTVTNPGVGNAGNVTAIRSTLAPSSPTTFTLVVKVNGNTPNNTDIVNTATVSSNTTDTNPNNNSTTTHTTALAQLDFGDAPASYGTLFADDGARHVLLNGLHMGANVDFETNGQPNATATGDDTNGIDDEDGVTLPAAFIVGRAAAAIVNASATGKLDAWIDFGRDGHFDPSDRIANSLVVSPGNNTIHFTVPADAVAGGTYARFRISTAGGLGPTGSAADGEVEDYATQIIFVAPGSVGVLPNPELPGKSQLSIEGTDGNDTITVTQLRSYRLLLQVTMNGVNRGTFSMANFQSIVVYAGAGDDTVTIKPGMQSFVHGEAGNDKLTTAGGFDDLFGGPGNDTLNSGGGDDYLEGDEGNDTLIAGAGNDVLLGGDGNDSLSGGSGRDILIGGLGADRESGGAGDDILIGGTTSHDNNRNAINQLMAIWGSSLTYPNRVNSISQLLNSSTVFDDGASDRLDGGADTNHDWFFDFLAADAIVNFNAKYDRKN